MTINMNDLNGEFGPLTDSDTYRVCQMALHTLVDADAMECVATWLKEEELIEEFMEYLGGSSQDEDEIDTIVKEPPEHKDSAYD